ncbi:MAG: DUF1947 domain-containing protein [Candidatus Odinarchaeia archaeon]
MEVKTRHYINSKKIRELNKKIIEVYPFLEGEVSLRNKKVEFIETDEGVILYAVNNELHWLEKNDFLLPSINLLNKGLSFMKAVVDMGAVPYISKGADVMAPGIVVFPENLDKLTTVKIVDEKHGKTIAIGQTLVTSAEFMKMKKGKAIKILHYVGDNIWKIALTLNLIVK